jgi:hypothetical protein
LIIICVYNAIGNEQILESVGWKSNLNFSTPFNLLIALGSSLGLLALIKSIAVRYKFIQAKSNSVELFFITLLLAAPSIFCLPLNTFAALFSGLMLFILLRIHNQQSVVGLIFTASILASISSIVSIYYAAFFILVPVTVLLLRSFKLKNFIILIVGFLLPYFYYLGIAYLFNYQVIADDFQLLKIKELTIGLTINFSLLLTISVISLLSMFYTLFKIQKLIVRQRNQIIIISLYLVISVALALLFDPILVLLPVAIAVSFFFGMFYQKLKRKWIMDSILILIWILSIWNNYIV